MSKSKEELNALKEEIEALNAKLAELSEEEMEQIIGGGHGGYYTKTYVCCMCGKECTEERRIGVYYPDGNICKDCLREKGQRRRPR